MKKTKLFSLTALALIGILGLSSCSSQGPKGDKGDQGIQGETGPKGDKGDPGENGEDGEDGATWLTGTTKPADTLGKLGDMYLNTSNGDVYQKEADGWKLKMNIQGEDGEDGKDGHNGSNGSTGPKGDTAWSNTILPVEGGYISANVGSATVGEEVTFTFNPTDSNSSFVWNIQNNGTVVNSSTGLTTTLTMMEGGFVVGGKVATSATTTITDGTLKVEVPSGAAEGKTIVAAVSEDVSVSSIHFDGTLNNNPVVISGTTNENGEKTTLTLNNESTIQNVSDLTFNDLTIISDVTTEEKGSLITVNNKDGSLSFNNVDFEVPTTEAGKGVTDSLIKAEVPSISLSGVTANFETQNNSVSLLGSQSTPLKELTVSGSNIDGTKGTAIHVQRFEQNAAINIKDSEFNCVTNFMMLAEKGSNTGAADTKNVDINLENVTINDNNVNPIIMFNLWENEGVDSASYFDVNVKDVYHNGTKLTKDNLKTEYEYINNVETASTVSTLSEEVNLLADEQILTRNTKGGLLAVYDVAWDGPNGRYSKKEVSTDDSVYPTVVIDGTTLSKASDFVKLVGTTGEVKKGENIFINGQYYSEVTYIDDNGVKTVVRGTPVKELKFASGDGLSEDTALVISSDAQFQLLNKIPGVGNPTINTYKTVDSLYFKLSNDIEVSAPISYFNGHLNGDNHTITFGSAFDCENLVTKSLFTNVYGKNVSFRNVSFNMHDNQNIVLMNYIWDSNFYLHNVDLENVDFNVLDSGVLNVNSGNFGFVTNNAPFTGNDTEEVAWSFKDVDITGSVNNIGTCTSVYIGSGPCPAGAEKVYNIKLEFTDCDVKGNFNSFEQVGIFYGNGSYYTDATKIKGKITATNCTFIGKAFAEKASAFSYANEAVENIADEMINNGLTVSGEGIKKGYDEVEGEIHLAYKDGLFVTNLEKNESSSYSLVFSVNTIVVDSKNNVSNGRKIMFDLENDSTLSETTITGVKAISSEDYKKVDASYEGSFDSLLENWKVDVVVSQEGVVYIIFDSEQSNFVSVKEGTTAYVVEKQDGKIIKRSTITFNK